VGRKKEKGGRIASISKKGVEAQRIQRGGKGPKKKEFSRLAAPSITSTEKKRKLRDLVNNQLFV